jgi:hypothetical protein
MCEWDHEGVIKERVGAAMRKESQRVYNLRFSVDIWIILR